MRITLPKTTDKYLRVLQYIVYGSVILYIGQNLFIPLSFAALIAFVFYPVCSWLEKRGLRRMPSILICITILVILFLGIIALLVQQFVSFLQEWPLVQEKFKESLEQLSQFFSEAYGVTLEKQQEWMAQIADQSAGEIFAMLRRGLAASAISSVLFVLIPVYATLILYYRHLLVEVIFRIFPKERKENIRYILLLTIGAYYNFIKGMAVVYLIVGVLNSAGLLLLGVPYAILFGFIAAILTFIPYVGILVGSLLPITMAWITFNSIWYPLGVVAIFAFVQYLEANIIFPLAVSNRLNVNTLATIMAIVAGGILWGVSGMILFVPFLAIVKLIADHNPKMRAVSMFLGTGVNKKNNPQ